MADKASAHLRIGVGIDFVRQFRAADLVTAYMSVTACIPPVIQVSFLVKWLFSGHNLISITRSHTTAQISATFEVIQPYLKH